MTLRQLVGAIRSRERELAVFNAGDVDRLRRELAASFETQNVRVTTRRTPSGRPTDVAVLSTDDEVLEVVDAGFLRDFLDHDPSGIGVADAAYADLLRHLKETTFTSYDTERMLYTSREIEDRARRVGRGRIHTGFQRCSVVVGQRAIYADLADRGLDVHAYGVPDATPPDLDGVRLHASDTDEIAATWFVVYDGGGDDAQKTALIAEERGDDAFYGAWTYDPAIVDAAVDYLEQRYVREANARGSSRSRPESNW